MAGVLTFTLFLSDADETFVFDGTVVLSPPRPMFASMGRNYLTVL